MCSSLCDQKRNKICTQTKWDTVLSFLTVYTQMESITLNVVGHRKITTLGIGRNFRMMSSQKWKVQWWPPEAIESRGGMTELHHLFEFFYDRNIACWHVIVVRIKTGSNKALFSSKRHIK